MKSILSVVLGVMALGLVAGCSDDSDSASVNCVFATAGTTVYCMSSSDLTEDQCTQAQGTVADSCPSGSVKSCEMSEDGKSGTIYVYSEEMAALMCQ